MHGLEFSTFSGTTANDSKNVTHKLQTRWGSSPNVTERMHEISIICPQQNRRQFRTVANSAQPTEDTSAEEERLFLAEFPYIIAGKFKHVYESSALQMFRSTRHGVNGTEICFWNERSIYDPPPR
uniref:(northern house mosquito) hypothetical protein n=1 Tax=Culex pipiens TaxID=7175 RepID=A0A8D8AD02_CULPI